jgi:MvaI/BcnI restriction endonuclease family
LNYVTDKDLFERLDQLLKVGTYDLADFGGWRGDGTPGFVLETLLGFDPTNKDGPDSGRWEVKFHSGNTPLTLLHKTPEPKGVVRELIEQFGWAGKSGDRSFRHTIWKTTARGFSVDVENDKIEIRHKDANFTMPFWSTDTLANAFIFKLRRLIVVHGKKSKSKGYVSFHQAQILQEPKIVEIFGALSSGMMAVDFDAKIRGDGTLRDHGTKLRMKISDLPKIYAKSKIYDSVPNR